MTLSTISSELLTPQQPNLVWWYTIISQSVLWKNWVTVFKVKVTQKVKMSVFVQKISSKLPNILLPNLVLWCSTISQSVMREKNYSISSRSRSVRAHMIKIWLFLSFYHIFWTVDFSARSDDTSSWARVSCEKRKEKDYCIQGQDQSEASKCQCLPR